MIPRRPPPSASTRRPDKLITDPASPSVLPKNFLRPCLLLLLREHPAHGYDLLERLRPLGFNRDDPGRLYRALRAPATARPPPAAGVQARRPGAPVPRAARAGDRRSRALGMGEVVQRSRPAHVRAHP